MFQLARQSKELDCEDIEWFEQVAVDPKRALQEVFYLRAFTVDYAAFRLLEGSPARDATLDVYRTHLREAANIAPIPGDLHLTMHYRVLLYAKAAEREHHLGPGWTVGCQFAEFIGEQHAKDPHVVIFGSIKFSTLYAAVRQFLSDIGEYPTTSGARKAS